jgi:hypothetical protein
MVGRAGCNRACLQPMPFNTEDRPPSTGPHAPSPTCSCHLCERPSPHAEALGHARAAARGLASSSAGRRPTRGCVESLIDHPFLCCRRPPVECQRRLPAQRASVRPAPPDGPSRCPELQRESRLRAPSISTGHGHQTTTHFREVALGELLPRKIVIGTCGPRHGFSGGFGAAPSRTMEGSLPEPPRWLIRGPPDGPSKGGTALAARAPLVWTEVFTGKHQQWVTPSSGSSGTYERTLRALGDLPAEPSGSSHDRRVRTPMKDAQFTQDVTSAFVAAARDLRRYPARITQRWEPTAAVSGTASTRAW